MSRTYWAVLAGLTAGITAFAGPIQIGGANGLSAAYVLNPNTITGQNTTGCATTGGCVNGSGGSVTGSATTWGERNYVASLFENSTVTSDHLNSNELSAQKNVGNTANFNPGANTWTDPLNNGGVTFALMNDGSQASGPDAVSNNFWASPTGGNHNAFVIPVGVKAVDKVWILVNDYYGYAGANPTLTFNFSSTGSNGAIDLADAIVVPDNANVSGKSNGPIRSAVDCDPTKVTGSGITCPATTTGAHIVTAGDPILSPITTTALALGADASITTSTVWSGSYTNSTGTTPYHSATGNVDGKLTLDDLGFDFGSKYANAWLVSITITPSSANINNQSRLAVSAITVDSNPGETSPTPEPGTIALITAGFGLLGLSRFRRKQ